MSRWKYDGYTKVKSGSGRHARMIERRIYICPDCQKSIRIETIVKPPMTCPNCGADMRGEQEAARATGEDQGNAAADVLMPGC